MLNCLIVKDSNIEIISMTCFHPLRASRLYDPFTGKFRISFDDRDLGSGQDVLLPCGQCLGCRLDHAKMWALRCMHEARMHEKNCFLTLTYSDENLPADGSVHVEELQKFFKRLRKRFPNSKIRYYACGEYGDLHMRPHFHAIVFGFDFPDKKPFFKTKHGDIVYRSEILEDLWSVGHSSIGTVTLNSCGYVARYVVKKFKGKDADEHYKKLGILPEFVVMSRRPGIGREWFEKYYKDVFPGDFVVDRNGKKNAPPRYYLDLLAQLDKDLYLEVDDTRAEKLAKLLEEKPEYEISSDLNFKDLHAQRHIKDVVVSKRIKRLKRGFENA